MADPIFDLLTMIAKSLTLMTHMNAAGDEMIFRVVYPSNPLLAIPPAGGLAGSSPGPGLLQPPSLLQINETTTEMALAAAPIDLSLLLKDVRFSAADLGSDATLGGLPISGLSTDPVLSDPPLAPNAKPAPGVAGVLAALTGTISLPILKTLTNPLDVQLDAHWKIRDEDGNPAYDVTSTLGTDNPKQAADILPFAGNGLLPLAVSLASAESVFVELTGTLPPPVRRTVQVDVRVSATTAGGVLRATTGWVPLPAVPVAFPAIPIPTMAIFFSNAQLQGYAFVAVPTSSPIGETSVISTLNSLSTTLNAIANIGINPTLALFGQLQTVLSALGTARRIVFRKTDGMTNISSVNFQHGSLGDPKGEDANDVLSSMLLIGAPGQAVQCFNDSDYQTDEGKFTLMTGADMIAVVRDLKSNNPATDPPGCLTVDYNPAGWNGDAAHWIKNFGDEITSFRFA